VELRFAGLNLAQPTTPPRQLARVTTERGRLEFAALSPEPPSRQAMRELIAADAVMASRHRSPSARHFAETQFEKVRTHTLLLWRKAPQDRDIISLLEAPVERQLETCIAQKYLKSFPQQTATTVHGLAGCLAARIYDLGPVQHKRFYGMLQAILRSEIQEFWEDREPIRSEIIEAADADAAHMLLMNYLNQVPQDGIRLVACLFLMREALRALEYKGLDDEIFATMQRASQHYLDHIRATKAPINPDVDVARFADGHLHPPTAGITMASQTSMAREPWMQAAAKPMNTRELDPDHPYIRDSARSGNVVVTGLSGTLNIFLFAAPVLDPMFTAEDKKHLTVALTCATIYAGGHSTNEVLEVAQMIAELGAPHLDTAPIAQRSAVPGYSPPRHYRKGEARLTLARLLDEVGCPGLIDAAIEDVTAHFRKHPEELDSPVRYMSDASEDGSSSSDDSSYLVMKTNSSKRS
jgi:hypothetical protein